MYQVIVVALDGTREADRALPVAQSLAHRMGAALDVVVVTSPGVDPADDEREIRQHARMVGVSVDQVRLRYDEDVASGILAETAADSSLLCMVSNARGALGEVIVGSTSGEVVRRAGGPLLLVGPQVVTSPPPGFGAALVCVDDSPASERVGLVAARWAASLSVPAHVLQVTEDGDAVPERRRGESAAGRAAAVLEAEGVDTTWDAVPAEEPAKVIISSAAHLPGPALMVGTHAASRRRRPALGTVSAAVVRGSPSPVLVVPA